jgi:hypothetical protein
MFGKVGFEINQGWKKTRVILGFLNIFAQKREFLGFFQFQEYF